MNAAVTDRVAHDRLLFLQGLQCFNQAEYYESHELLEDLWLRNRSSARPLLQGLIQLAAAFHHQTRGNFVGFVHLLAAARSRLADVDPRLLGVELAPLLLEIAAAEAHAQELGPERVKEFRSSHVPAIAFTPPGLPEFEPHRGTAPGPAHKRDWYWGRTTTAP